MTRSWRIWALRGRPFRADCVNYPAYQFSVRVGDLNVGLEHPGKLPCPPLVPFADGRVVVLSWVHGGSRFHGATVIGRGRISRRRVVIVSARYETRRNDHRSVTGCFRTRRVGVGRFNGLQRQYHFAAGLVLAQLILEDGKNERALRRLACVVQLAKIATWLPPNANCAACCLCSRRPTMPTRRLTTTRSNAKSPGSTIAARMGSSWRWSPRRCGWRAKNANSLLRLRASSDAPGAS